MNKGIFAVVLGSLAASLCCITPVFALLAGFSSFAGAFSWMEDYRIYLIVFTLGVLTYVWYKQLNKNISCAISQESFINSKLFLILITIFAVLSLTFPYYGSFFIKEEKTKQSLIIKEKNILTYKIKIDKTG